MPIEEGGDLSDSDTPGGPAYNVKLTGASESQIMDKVVKPIMHDLQNNSEAYRELLKMLTAAQKSVAHGSPQSVGNWLRDDIEAIVLSLAINELSANDPGKDFYTVKTSLNKTALNAQRRIKQNSESPNLAEKHIHDIVADIHRGITVFKITEIAEAEIDKRLAALDLGKKHDASRASLVEAAKLHAERLIYPRPVLMPTAYSGFGSSGFTERPLPEIDNVDPALHPIRDAIFAEMEKFVVAQKSQGLSA